MIVDKPMLLEQQRTLDFGPGFYLTSSENQAVKWAKNVTKRRAEGEAMLSVFSVDDCFRVNLRVLEFESANAEWLEYVVQNRRGVVVPNDYDVVIGPVANDNTLPVIDNYMDGIYTIEEAVKRLLPQNLTDQFAFKTEEALSVLSFLKGGAV